MKINIREENEVGTKIWLHSDNISIGNYIIPSEALFVTMRLILRDAKRLGETCEFVLID